LWGGLQARRVRRLTVSGPPGSTTTENPMPALLLPLLLWDVPTPPPADLAQAVDLARITPNSPLVGRPGRFVFTPDSRPDDTLGFWAVEAEGPDDCVRTVYFARGEGDEGPVVVEGTLAQLLPPGPGRLRCRGRASAAGRATGCGERVLRLPEQPGAVAWRPRINAVDGTTPARHPPTGVGSRALGLKLTGGKKGKEKGGA
jgi:hypothetical protein